MQDEVSQDRVGFTPDVGPLKRAVGIGYGYGPDRRRPAVLEAIDDLGFSLQMLAAGGELDIWFEVSPDTPHEQLLPAIQSVCEVAGAPIVGEIDVEVDDELDGELIVELIAWIPPWAC